GPGPLRGPPPSPPRSASRLADLAAAAGRRPGGGEGMKNQLATQANTLPAASEVGTLARELAAAYRDRVHRHKHEPGLSKEEAAAKAEAPSSLDQQFRVQDCPPEQVTWDDLEGLARGSPGRMLERWEEVKAAAREELQSGHRAGGVL